MKTELKTLKNIDKDCYTYAEHQEIIEDIRAEAIKRAKELDKKMDECKKGELEEIKFLYYKGRFDEVMEFNNLTDEDLK